jgi:hypothetical protein
MRIHTKRGDDWKFVLLVQFFLIIFLLTTVCVQWLNWLPPMRKKKEAFQIIEMPQTCNLGRSTQDWI